MKWVRMELVWTFLLQDSGEAGKPRKAFLMSKCLLLLMHLHNRGTQVSSLYRCFEHEKQRNYETSSTMEMRWVLLPHLYFQHLVQWWY